MLDGLLQVATRAGAYFLGSDQQVYVHAGFSPASGKDLILQKRGRDLNIGDLVLLHAKRIDIPLSEIKNDLDTSNPDYHRARHTVLALNEQQQEIPYFRQILIFAVAQKSNVSPDPQKTMRLGGNDYTPDEYSRMADTLEELIKDVNRATLFSWLQGEALSPQNWDTYRNLATVDPRFGDIHTSKNRPEGFHASYRLYVGVHQVIRRTILGFGEGADNARYPHGEEASHDSKHRPLSRSYEPQLRAVFERYGHLVEEKIMAFRVEDLKAVKRAPARIGGASHPSVGSRGVLTTYTPNPEHITFQQLFDMQVVLNMAIQDGLEMYFNATAQGQLEYRVRLPLVNSLYIALGPKIFDSDPYGNGMRSLTEELDIAEFGLLDTSAFIAKTAGDLWNRYRNGTLDELLKVPISTWQTTIEAANKVSRLVPRTLHETFVMDPLMIKLDKAIERNRNVPLRSRHTRRRYESAVEKIERRMERARKYLKEEYGAARESGHVLKYYAIAFTGDGMLPLKDNELDFTGVRNMMDTMQQAPDLPRPFSRRKVDRLLIEAQASLAIHLLDPKHWT